MQAKKSDCTVPAPEQQYFYREERKGSAEKVGVNAKHHSFDQLHQLSSPGNVLPQNYFYMHRRGESSRLEYIEPINEDA